MKKVYKHIAISEEQMQGLIALAKQKGLKRTQNAYWFEFWENDTEKHIFERDLQKSK